jgi:hypothetical protein
MNREVLSELRKMDADTFEHFVAHLWEQFGWETEVTASSRDGGVDVIAVQHSPTEQRHGIQAKRYRRGSNVSSPTVRGVAGQLQKGFDSVAIVTTGGFTSPAKEDADQLGVKTVGSEEIRKMVSDVGISTDDLDQFTISTPKQSQNVDLETSVSGQEEATKTTEGSGLHGRHTEMMAGHLERAATGDTQFVDYFFEIQDELDRHYQVNAGIQHNLTIIPEGRYDRTKKYVQDGGLEVVNDDEYDGGGYMLLEHSQSVHTISAEKVASTTEALLDIAYDIELVDVKDIKETTHRGVPEPNWTWPP